MIKKNLLPETRQTKGYITCYNSFWPGHSQSCWLRKHSYIFSIRDRAILWPYCVQFPWSRHFIEKSQKYCLNAYNNGWMNWHIALSHKEEIRRRFLRTKKELSSYASETLFLCLREGVVDFHGQWILMEVVFNTPMFHIERLCGDISLKIIQERIKWATCHFKDITCTSLKLSSDLPEIWHIVVTDGNPSV